MRLIGLCHQQQTAGIPVNAVHDSRADHTIDGGELSPAMPQQGIYQGAIGIARRRMHHHTLWLVYHNDALVLIDDVHRNILRNCCQLHRVRNENCQLLPCFQPGIFLHWLAVHGHQTIGNQRLNLGSGTTPQ